MRIGRKAEEELGLYQHGIQFPRTPMKPFRLTVALTHPVQYFSPWFRWIAAHCPEIDLEVIYAVEPTAEQQGTGFGRAFEWDVPLREGYRSTVVRPGRAGDELGTGAFRGLDVPELAERVVAGRPDAVLVPGWYSVTLTRVIAACRRAGIPLIYRGDSTLDTPYRGLSRIGWHLATRRRLARYSSWLAVGTKARRYLLAHGVPGTSIFASHHALEPVPSPRDRSAVRAELGLSDADFAVLFVGKLAPIKRPLDLVEAVARLEAGAALVVAGSGPLAGEHHASAERLGVRRIALGFVNQAALPGLYAAADVLALPSESETWGFAAHEALAAGTPVVVTDTVGCVPDLVVPGTSGEVVPVGDIAALAAALEGVRAGRRAGRYPAVVCRRAVAGHSFAAASRGLVAALERLARPERRVLALLSGLVVPGGLERQTCAVLAAQRAGGAAVHGVLNDWENRAIVPLVEELGASWSTARYRVALDRRTRNPVRLARMAADVVAANVELLGAVRRFRPTAVLVPDELAVLRHAPVLLALKALGRPVVLRVGNAPLEGRFQGFLWRQLLPRIVTRMVANSKFGERRLREVGVPEGRIGLIRNAAAPRLAGDPADPLVARLRARPTILVVGQIAPFKGTDLALEAFEVLRDEVPDLQLVIVGRWPDWPEALVQWADALRARAPPEVLFPGAREDVPALMAAATVLAAPILQAETFGNVVLEARNAGLPAVVFPSGGLPELVEHRVTGWVCPRPELADLVLGLRYFLGDPAARAAASAAALAWAARPDDPYRSEEFAARWWEMLA
jgi:glycosyltransferase involved in cell wall biosynthesis